MIRTTKEFRVKEFDAKQTRLKTPVSASDLTSWTMFYLNLTKRFVLLGVKKKIIRFRICYLK